MKVSIIFWSSLIFSVVLISNSNISANCGHCCMGMSYQYKKENVHHHNDKDSLKIRKFKETNASTINKIKKLQEQIKDEYSNTNPDFDKIAKLKKKVIDYHIMIEKLAMEQKLHEHHHCWCPMHHTK